MTTSCPSASARATATRSPGSSTTPRAGSSAAGASSALSAVTASADWGALERLLARDDAALVQQIRNRVLPRRGVFASTDEIVVTVGAQQALYLIADVLVAPGTVVGIEDPGYPDARNIFAARDARLVPLPVDAAAASAYLRNHRDVNFMLQFTRGIGQCEFFTSDLTPEYVRLNADYTT